MTCKTEGCGRETAGKSRYCAEHRAAAHAAWLSKVRESAAEREARNKAWADLHAEAHAAGMAASEACKPVPMVVQEHEHPLDDGSPVVRSWTVPEGPCGFAWVVIRPGTCSFARWMRANHGADKDYYGGVSVWCPLNTQSVAIKEAYCEAYAEVLRSRGIKAHAKSRLD